MLIQLLPCPAGGATGPIHRVGKSGAHARVPPVHAAPGRSRQARGVHVQQHAPSEERAGAAGTRPRALRPGSHVAASLANTPHGAGLAGQPGGVLGACYQPRAQARRPAF